MACGMKDITLLQVHHIRRFGSRGSNKPWNLSVLCPTCHAKAQKGQLTPPVLAPKPTSQHAKKTASPRIEPILLQIIVRIMDEPEKYLIIANVSNEGESKAEECDVLVQTDGVTTNLSYVPVDSHLDRIGADWPEENTFTLYPKRPMWVRGYVNAPAGTSITIMFRVRGQEFHRRSFELPSAPKANVGRDIKIEVERDRNQVARAQRELALKIYTPVRKEILSWLEFGNPSFIEWERVNMDKPYWAKRVPEEIADLLWYGKNLSQKVGSLNLEFWDLFTRVSFQARERIGLSQNRPGPGLVSFRVFSRDNLLGTHNVKNLWFAGKTLREYVQDFIDEHFPDVEWEVDLQVDGFTVGDTLRAYQFSDEALALLEKEPRAIELRTAVEKLRNLGKDILERIDEELARD